MKKNIIIVLWFIVIGLLSTFLLMNKKELVSNKSFIKSVNNTLIVKIINKEWLYAVNFNNSIIGNNGSYITVNTNTNYSGNYIKNDDENNFILSNDYKIINKYQKDIKMNRFITEIHDLNSWNFERINLRNENDKYIQIEKIIGYKKNQD